MRSPREGWRPGRRVGHRTRSKRGCLKSPHISLILSSGGAAYRRMPFRLGASPSPFDTPPSAATQGEEKGIGGFQGTHTGLFQQAPCGTPFRRRGDEVLASSRASAFQKRFPVRKPAKTGNVQGETAWKFSGFSRISAMIRHFRANAFGGAGAPARPFLCESVLFHLDSMLHFLQVVCCFRIQVRDR